MSLEEISPGMISAIEEQLKKTVDKIKAADLDLLHYMIAYHMGWEGENAGPEARGKRIRPLLVLLCAASAGGDWHLALPAAAAVELIHNFSLIHDDIEDNSPLRRGRPTVWKLWGVPQAINTGDALFALGHLAILDLERDLPAEVTTHASRILQETCLSLTQGQHLDIAYEDQGTLSLEAYWPMVSGKTAALLAACTELGALAVRAGADALAAYRQFGKSLGLAFQAQDDLLGIWGDSARTGKSAESDLVSGKKSLPVLYGLSQGGVFAARWVQGPITPAEVPVLAEQLEQSGAFSYTQERASQLTEQALRALDQAHPRGPAGDALRELALKLMHRQV